MTDEPESAPIHVVPENDTHQHETSTLCSCMPLTRDEGRVVIHNSFDRREVGEVLKLALDTLGIALTNLGHVWSAMERELFDHAQHLLVIHWPRTE